MRFDKNAQHTHLFIQRLLVRIILSKKTVVAQIENNYDYTIDLIVKNTYNE